MIYTIALNPSLDYDLYFDSFNAGSLNTAQKVNYRASGKAINVSTVLLNLGVESIVIGFAGAFTGDFIISGLNAIGLKHRLISVSEPTRINAKLFYPSGETEIGGVSPNISKENLENLFDTLKIIAPGDTVIFSGSIPPSIPDDIYKKIALSLPPEVITILDTRGNGLLKNICGSYLCKPNIGELNEMLAAAGQLPANTSDPADIAEKAKFILNAGVKNVIVSLGGEGAVFINDKGYNYLAAPKGKVINTMGAGDSMVAGFIAAKTEGLDDCEAFKYAVCCGSATAFSYGMAEKQLVGELYAKI